MRSTSDHDPRGNNRDGGGEELAESGMDRGASLGIAAGTFREITAAIETVDDAQRRALEPNEGCCGRADVSASQVVVE
jgi:hypothetical protein